MLGCYLAAAGHAETNMQFLLWDLEDLGVRKANRRTRHWSELVEALLKLPEHPFSERIVQLLLGAERRGRMRNHMVHCGWFSVRDGQYCARRALPDGTSTFLLADRSILTGDIEVMTKFAHDLQQLRADIAESRGR